MSAIACNFALLSTFNAKYDVTWSFQYSLCGPPDATGGFVTFACLDVPTLVGGVSGVGLGYGTTSSGGLSGALMGIGFDSTGAFAATGADFDTGVDTATSNVAVLRTGSDFTYQGNFVLPFNVVSTEETYKTLRFNLTDVGQTMRVHLLDESTKQYNLLGSLSTGYVFESDTYVRIGVSVATPVSGDVGCVFKLKDFHHQGKLVGL